MLFEQLIFAILAFALFVIVFYKMIKNNDTSYIILLILEAIGILMNFMEVLFAIKLNIVWKTIAYLIAILLPLFILILEKNNLRLIEIVNLAKAKVYLFLGNEKAAKDALIHLVTKHPGSYYGHKMLAEIYEKEGGMRKAIDEYVQVIDIRKNDYDCYYKIANLLNDLDKKEEASQMLHNLLMKKPEYGKATELLGEILVEQEKYKEAVHIYTEGLKFDPTNFDLYYNLGIAYTMLNDFQNAKACYEKAAEFNSLFYNSKYSLAEIALIYKELEEAEKHFLEVVEDEELEADAYYELAKISIIRGEKEKAIRYANIAVESNPKKIVEKLEKDDIFIPIIAKIAIPFHREEEKTYKRLKKKEIKAKEHLEEMFDITRNLGYQDINQLHQSGKRKKIEGTEKQIEEEKQKEREG